MNSKLIELLEKEIVSIGELEEIEYFLEVTEVENCGNSGSKVGYNWFNVKTVDGEYSVYVDQNNEN